MNNNSPTGELTIVVFPLEAYKKLSDIAFKQGKTATQALQEAIGEWLTKNKV